MHPTAVRGNASEIRFLAGVGTGGKGVDSLDDSSSAIEAAKALARKYKTFVVVTGHKDYATDGERVLCAVGGSEMMTLVVGTGCYQPFSPLSSEARSARLRPALPAATT